MYKVGGGKCRWARLHRRDHSSQSILTLPNSRLRWLGPATTDAVSCLGYRAPCGTVSDVLDYQTIRTNETHLHRPLFSQPKLGDDALTGYLPAREGRIQTNGQGWALGPKRNSEAAHVGRFRNPGDGATHPQSLPRMPTTSRRPLREKNVDNNLATSG